MSKSKTYLFSKIARNLNIIELKNINIAIVYQMLLYCHLRLQKNIS